jgi:hypothetical protein
MMHDAHVISTYTPAPTTYYTHVRTPVTHLQPPVIYTHIIYTCNTLVQRRTDTRTCVYHMFAKNFMFVAKHIFCVAKHILPVVEDLFCVAKHF